MIYVNSVSVSWDVFEKIKTITLIKGESIFAIETVLPSNATKKCVCWESSNKKVATVNEETGLVIAQGVGTATITATACDGSGKSDTLTVTVREEIKVTGIQVTPENLTLKKG